MTTSIRQTTEESPIGDVKCFVEAAFPTFVKQGDVTFTCVAHTGMAF